MSFFTSFNQEDCVLKTKRVDIWQFPLTTESHVAQFLLNKEELIRAQRFYFPRHQRRFTIARAMLRVIVARYLNTTPNEIEFTYNPHGKPALFHYPELEFNVSHSKDLALVAIGYKFSLGIDLEFFSARPYMGISKHIFSVHEIQALNKVTKYLQPLGFFHLWTQKEALIKACGLGLSYPTQQFDLPLLPPTHQQLVDPQYQQSWTIRSFMPRLNCCAALCHHPSVQEVRYITALPEEIL